MKGSNQNRIKNYDARSAILSLADSMPDYTRARVNVTAKYRGITVECDTLADAFEVQLHLMDGVADNLRRKYGVDIKTKVVDVNADRAIVDVLDKYFRDTASARNAMSFALRSIGTDTSNHIVFLEDDNRNEIAGLLHTLNGITAQDEVWRAVLQQQQGSEWQPGVGEESW